VLFGLLAFLAPLVPSSIGYQDIGALLAHQPGVADRWRNHIIASPFGTIHAAMFSFARPIGTSMPRPPAYQRVKLDPDEITGSIARDEEAIDLRKLPPIEYPSVDRAHKGDRLITQQSQSAVPHEMSETTIEARIDAMVGRDTVGDTSDIDDVELPYFDQPPLPDLTKRTRKVQNGDSNELYFGVDPLSTVEQVISPWAPGAAPVIMTQPGDSDIKLAALTHSEPKTDTSGESQAPKGEVTGADQRPKTPAERLGLEGKARAKAEKCLANAVYFEARGEPVRGQMAVAQVVMNRVFSPFYPNDVCGVVYQNAHRHNACQFTFACDGIPDVVTEQDMWIRAKRIAKETLDGKLWLPEIGKSTHYHAYWVRPSWVGEMKKMFKLGVHTFYRPRAWGDGSDEPKWGDAAATLEAVKQL
jgi:spore germination cell wall hydrolase CwlJ-like protein